MGLLRIVRWLLVSRILRRALRGLIAVVRYIGWRRVAHSLLRLSSRRRPGRSGLSGLHRR